MEHPDAGAVSADLLLVLTAVFVVASIVIGVRAEARVVHGPPGPPGETGPAGIDRAMGLPDRGTGPAERPVRPAGKAGSYRPDRQPGPVVTVPVVTVPGQGPPGPTGPVWCHG